MEDFIETMSTGFVVVIAFAVIGCVASAILFGIAGVVLWLCSLGYQTAVYTVAAIVIALVGIYRVGKWVRG